MVWRVEISQHDHRFSFGPKRAWIGAPRNAIRQPSHLAVMTGRHKLVQPCPGLIDICGSTNTDLGKTYGFGLGR